MKESESKKAFYAELKEWRTEMVKDIDLITEGLKIQEKNGQAEILKFYRGLSHKILKWKQFVTETNAANLDD